jgi:hypothetical protein
MRAKTIKNKPKVNEVVSEAGMMKRLEREIERLREQLKEEKTRNSEVCYNYLLISVYAINAFSFNLDWRPAVIVTNLRKRNTIYSVTFADGEDGRQKPTADMVSIIVVIAGDT